MNRFYFGDSDDSGSDFDETTSGLPFPKPLSRASFLAPDFDPAGFLSSLTNRHQTLEDLRLELRQLSQSLNKELLDLVNENYQDFLSLGSALHGGEEKIEEVRVGLLGFQRDVGTIRDRVDARRLELERLLAEKKRLRNQTNVGKALLDVAERIEELEQRLMIAEPEKPGLGSPHELDTDSDILDTEREESDEDDDDDDDDDHDDDSDDLGDETGTTTVVPLKRLEQNIQKFVYIAILSERIGDTHPFLVNQQPRILKIKATLLLDLNAALEQAKQSGEKKDTRVLKIMRLYDLIGEEAGALSALKQLRI
ncbi:hypothetical protein DTO164E3_3393 [Paecilomyces variotii]|nr:hypothetical protein DTO032I3_6318 [Paecilomyces variotii]KAJ9201955.1 hypothetical protein DTO164E3_3393 [Paecilomyces variotii]KAJ9225150.1 hypothetical protein DTO169C6_2491 [Paecilomyces variotii]KAJ9251935.1 hypothetical protein DTO207G8_5150 [Paecilomyces variotii]KAJ9263632.1 hypothetical protein DTO195F2_2892 [Paecilomyces variotii]